MTGTFLRRTASAAATATALVVLAGCGSSSSSTATAPESTASSSTASSNPPSSASSSDTGSSAGAMIMIKDFAYTGSASVKPGATVTVMNNDSEAHTVTADGAGGFDVTIDPGKSATLTAPSKPGSYPYHCTFHSNMHGTLTVS